MKLLIFTQAVDVEEPVLSFFHRWIEELASRFDYVTVICLKEGKHSLPANVRVLSLGKESGRSRLKYVLRFYSYIWSLRHEYDAVFIHMNQEYVILGGWFWKIMGKHVYMWRNHHTGNFYTDIAAAFCTNVFCTSTHSYTAKYKKTIIMPVGVDIARFIPNENITRIPHSILFLSGMWPSKRAEMLIDALMLLSQRGIHFVADFYGSPLPESEEYYAVLQERVRQGNLSDRVTFYPGVPNTATPDLYRSHEVFVNCSPSGMFDKTLFEAAASGCRVLAASDDFAVLTKDSTTHFTGTEELAQDLALALAAPIRASVPAYVGAHSLITLADKLKDAIH